MINNTDFIEVFDESLSTQECKYIIDYIDNKELIRGGFNASTRTPGVVENIVDSKEKDCWQVEHTYLTKGSDDESKIIAEMLMKVLRKTSIAYGKLHPECMQVIPWYPYEGYNMQKYDPGQAYHGLHCENYGDPVGTQRCLVWMIYLNTVKDKGGTYFSNYNRTLEPVEGRCVIWPAYWTHFHKGIPSPTETKYIATGWFVHQEIPGLTK
tara:strand:+ start:853 stop:1482 length:630 start_codon:yes stop_codon:yes gene_type:complete